MAAFVCLLEWLWLLEGRAWSAPAVLRPAQAVSMLLPFSSRAMTLRLSSQSLLRHWGTVLFLRDVPGKLLGALGAGKCRFMQ